MPDVYRPGSGHAWRSDIDVNRLRQLPAPAGSAAGRVAGRIADALTEAIRAGIYRQGERLPSAEKIAHRFTVSKDTGRAALRELADRGIVARAGGRMYVRGCPAAPGTRPSAARSV